MCTYSMVSDYFQRTFPDRYPNTTQAMPAWTTTVAPVDRREFDALKAEVAALKELLKAAKTFDEKTGQKDCETDEKIAFLKKIAEFVGVDLKDAI